MSGLPRNYQSHADGDTAANRGLDSKHMSAQRQQQQPEHQQHQHRHQAHRYSNKAATAIARLAPSFLYSSRPLSPHDRGNSSTGIATDSGSPPVASNLEAQPSHRAESPWKHSLVIDKPIASIDRSPDGQHAIIAGRDLLQTIRVEASGSTTEGINIIRQINAKVREQLAIVDVKWDHHTGNLIATAAGSGRIAVYDLNKPSFEFVTLYEHVRQVHKLAFNPHGSSLFLSGSHDGAIKLWDLRDARDARRSRATFQGASHSIRDVKWSFTDGVEFAAGTDSGVVQRWDMRKPKAPIIQLNAHDQTCHSIDFHPSSKHLASAGADKKVKIWDTMRTERRQHPAYILQTPSPVYNVCWRPDSDPLASDRGSVQMPRHAIQIATSYDARDNRVHIWDFERQSIPCRELDWFEDPTTSLLWRSHDFLWSAGSSSNRGRLSQSDVNNALRPLERSNVNILAVAPNGDMAFYAEDRATPEKQFENLPVDHLHSFSADSSSGEKLSSSYSPIDSGQNDRTPAASKLRSRRQKALATRQKEKAFRENAPSTGHSDSPPTDLTDTTYLTTQSGAFGTVRGVFDSIAFAHLANSYSNPRKFPAQTGNSAALQIEQLFIRNSLQASHINDSGLSHTWRILAWAVKKELEDWNSLTPDEKVQLCQQSDKPQTQSANAEKGLSAFVDDKGKRGLATSEIPSDQQVKAYSSNLATPRAQPLVDGSNGSADVEQLDISSSSRLGESVFLSMHPRNTESSGSASRRDGDTKSTERSSPKTGTDAKSSIPEDMGRAHELYDLENTLTARRAATSNYRMTPRPILKLGNTINRQNKSSTGIKPNTSIISHDDLARHNSGDSFEILSESMNSSNRSLRTGSLDESSIPGQVSFGALRGSFDSLLGDATGDNLGNTPDSQTQNLREGKTSELHSLSRIGLGSKDTDRVSAPDTSVPRDGHLIHGPARPSVTSLPVVHKQDFANLDDGDVAKGPIEVEHSAKKVDIPSSSVTAAAILHLPATGIVQPKPTARPWHASSFLSALIDHHLDRLSSIQLPVFLALYLYRLYPRIFPTWKTKNAERASLSRESYHRLHTLPYAKLLAVILTYHGQLNAMRQFVAAAELRKSCEGLYPEVAGRVAPGQLSVWWCRVCQKPSKGNIRGQCLRCGTPWAGCSVCGELTAPLRRIDATRTTKLRMKQDGAKPGAQAQTRPSRRWIYCQSCGHGGHSRCVSSWLANALSGGACAVPGCLHACGPGKRRIEAHTALNRVKAEAAQLRKGHGILRDDRIAAESRAVTAVRPEALEVDVGEIWSDSISANSNNAAAMAAGIPMESVGGPGMGSSGAGGGGIGRGRWRNRRAGRTSTGSGSGGLAGLATNRSGSAVITSDPSSSNRHRRQRLTSEGTAERETLQEVGEATGALEDDGEDGAESSTARSFSTDSSHVGVGPGPGLGSGSGSGRGVAPSLSSSAREAASFQSSTDFDDFVDEAHAP